MKLKDGTCDKCGKTNPQSAGCTHAGCGGTFIAQGRREKYFPESPKKHRTAERLAERPPRTKEEEELATHLYLQLHKLGLESLENLLFSVEAELTRKGGISPVKTWRNQDVFGKRRW